MPIFRAASETDEEKKKEAMTSVLTTQFPNWLAVHEKRLEAQGHENFIAGDKMTIADIVFASFLASMVYNEGNALHA